MEKIYTISFTCNIFGDFTVTFAWIGAWMGACLWLLSWQALRSSYSLDCDLYCAVLCCNFSFFGMVMVHFSHLYQQWAEQQHQHQHQPLQQHSQRGLGKRMRRSSSQETKPAPHVNARKEYVWAHSIMNESNTH